MVDSLNTVDLGPKLGPEKSDGIDGQKHMRCLSAQYCAILSHGSLTDHLFGPSRRRTFSRILGVGVIGLHTIFGQECIRTLSFEFGD